MLLRGLDSVLFMLRRNITLRYAVVKADEFLTLGELLCGQHQLLLKCVSVSK